MKTMMLTTPGQNWLAKEIPRHPTPRFCPLLPEHSGEWDHSLEDVSARSSTVTVVLAEILGQSGFPHGGINE